MMVSRYYAGGTKVHRYKIVILIIIDFNPIVVRPTQCRVVLNINDNLHLQGNDYHHQNLTQSYSLPNK